MIPEKQLEEILSSLKKHDDRFFYSTDAITKYYYSPFNIHAFWRDEAFEQYPDFEPHKLMTELSKTVISKDTKFYIMLKDIKIASNLINRLNIKYASVRLDLYHCRNAVLENKEESQEDRNMKKLINILLRKVPEFIADQNKIRTAFFENAYYRLYQQCSQNASPVPKPSIDWIELSNSDPDQFYSDKQSASLHSANRKNNPISKAFIPTSFMDNFMSSSSSNQTMSGFLHRSFQYLIWKSSQDQFNDLRFSDKYGRIIKEMDLLYNDEKFVNGCIVKKEKEKEAEEKEAREPEPEIVPETRKKVRVFNYDGVQPAKKPKPDDSSPLQVSPPSHLSTRYGPEIELMKSIKEINDKIDVTSAAYENATNPNLRYPICSHGIEKLKQISIGLELFLREVPDELK